MACLLAGAGQVLEEREGESLTEDRDEGETPKRKGFLKKVWGVIL